MRKNLILILCVIALSIGAVFWYKSQYKKPQQNQGKILADKERDLTQDQKQLYADRIKKAQEDLSSLRQDDKDYRVRYVNDYMYLGQQYFGLGLLEKSKQHYLKVLQLDSGNESALVALAYTYTDAGELEQAKAIYEDVIKNNPKNYNLWLQYIDNRKTLAATNEDIKKLFEEALEATNRYADVITKYAQFQESAGSINESIALWQEAAKVNPERAQMYNQEISRLKALKNSPK